MNDSIKKLYNHMDKKEIHTLKQSIRSIHNPKMTNHASKSIKQRNIRLYDVYDVLNSYKIVEYHRRIRDGIADNRVLLRGSKTSNCNNICIVVSLDTKEVITVYQNEFGDKHNTLNPRNYNRNANILQYIN